MRGRHRYTCPDFLTNERDRFFWRWARIVVYHVQLPWMNTPCHLVDFNKSKSAGVNSSTYTSSVLQYNAQQGMNSDPATPKQISLPRAIAKFINGEDIKLKVTRNKFNQQDNAVVHYCHISQCVNPKHIFVRPNMNHLGGRTKHAAVSGASYRIQPEHVHLGLQALSLVGTVASLVCMIRKERRETKMFDMAQQPRRRNGKRLRVKDL